MVNVEDAHFILKISHNNLSELKGSVASMLGSFSCPRMPVFDLWGYIEAEKR